MLEMERRAEDQAALVEARQALERVENKANSRQQVARAKAELEAMNATAAVEEIGDPAAEYAQSLYGKEEEEDLDDSWLLEEEDAQFRRFEEGYRRKKGGSLQQGADPEVGPELRRETSKPVSSYPEPGRTRSPSPINRPGPQHPAPGLPRHSSPAKTCVLSSDPERRPRFSRGPSPPAALPRGPSTGHEEWWEHKIPTPADIEEARRTDPKDPPLPADEVDAMLRRPCASSGRQRELGVPSRADSEVGLARHSPDSASRKNPSGHSRRTPQEGCRERREYSLSGLLRALRMPQIEISKFSGNPLEFANFMADFEGLIEPGCTSDSERLSRLFHYCEGEAKEVVVRSFCTDRHNSESYSSAKRRLQDLYGRNSHVAQQWVDKLLAMRATSIRDMVFQARNGFCALRQLGGEQETNASVHMRGPWWPSSPPTCSPDGGGRSWTSKSGGRYPSSATWWSSLREQRKKNTTPLTARAPAQHPPDPLAPATSPSQQRSQSENHVAYARRTTQPRSVQASPTSQPISAGSWWLSMGCASPA